MNNIRVYKAPLDTYTAKDRPEEMDKYLSFNGWHFNKKMCDFAVSKMYKVEPGATHPTQIKPYTKEQVDAVLEKYGVKLENNTLYDHVYVANMCKADFYGSSIIDEPHLALYIKNVIDDVDAPDGIIFRQWLVKMDAAGEPIDWDGML